MEEVKTEDGQAYVTIPPSNSSEADGSIPSGHVTSKESDPPKLPWPKSPELCFSVAESNSVLTEGEESDVESCGSGLEIVDIPVVPSGERNVFKVPSVCGNVRFCCIYCVVRELPENCAVHRNLAVGQK